MDGKLRSALNKEIVDPHVALSCLAGVFNVQAESGAAMFAPMVNPYESSMTKEEMSGTWEMWVRRRTSQS